MHFKPQCKYYLYLYIYIYFKPQCKYDSVFGAIGQRATATKGGGSLLLAGEAAVGEQRREGAAGGVDALHVPGGQQIRWLIP